MVYAAEIIAERYYDDEAISSILLIGIDKVRAEVNRGRLRATKRAGRLFCKGEWLINPHYSPRTC